MIINEYSKIINIEELLKSEENNFTIQVVLNQSYEDVGFLTEVDNNDLLILTSVTDTFELAPITPSGPIVIQAQLNNLIGFVNTLNPQSNFITGETESRLNELLNWGGGYVQYIPNPQKDGVINNNGSEISYIIGGIRYLTRLSDNYTTYQFPINGYRNGLNDINFNNNGFFVKEEIYLKQYAKPLDQNEIFIERNTESVFERMNKINELEIVDFVEEYQLGLFYIQED